MSLQECQSTGPSGLRIRWDSWRLQLLSSILYSIQVYWFWIFILPKKIIKAIEQKFNRFLWNGRDSGSAEVKVAWADLCFPKKEGGLGLKNLEVWNRASMLRQIWNLFARSGSIWVARIKENMVKGKRFWSIGVLGWKKLLKLHDTAKKFLKFEVGDGKSIHLLASCWSLA